MGRSDSLKASVKFAAVFPAAFPGGGRALAWVALPPPFDISGWTV